MDMTRFYEIKAHTEGMIARGYPEQANNARQLCMMVDELLEERKATADEVQHLRELLEKAGELLEENKRALNQVIGSEATLTEAESARAKLAVAIEEPVRPKRTRKGGGR